MYKDSVGRKMEGKRDEGWVDETWVVLLKIRQTKGDWLWRAIREHGLWWFAFQRVFAAFFHPSDPLFFLRLALFFSVSSRIFFSVSSYEQQDIFLDERDIYRHSALRIYISQLNLANFFSMQFLKAIWWIT